MKIIGKNVVLMLPTIDCWDLIESDEVFLVLPIDETKWKRNGSCKLVYNSLFKSKKNVTLEKVVISNSGFTLSIFPDYEKSLYIKFLRPYTHVNLVKIEHPELKKYPFVIATYVDCVDFVKLVSKSMNIINGTLSGEFCCIHEAGYSGISHTTFDVEDPDNHAMKEEKAIGKLISEGKKTIKWETGYGYITKTGRTFIYLGEITGSFIKPMNGCGFGECFPTNFYSIEKIEGPVSLIIDTTALDQGQLDLVLSNKGGFISVFLLSILSYAMNSKLLPFREGLRTINKKTHPAVKVEKFFEDDGKNLKELLVDFYTSRYNTYQMHNPLVDRSRLTGKDRETFDGSIKKIIHDYVTCKRTYYSSSSSTMLDISIAKDPEGLLNFLKANKPSYRSYRESIYGVLEYLGEEEFKKLVSECTF